MVENISSVLSADSISTLLAAAALAPSSQEEEKFDVVLVLSVCHRVMGRWTLKMIGGARRSLHCNAPRLLLLRTAAAAIIGGKIKASQDEDPEILMVHTHVVSRLYTILEVLA